MNNIIDHIDDTKVKVVKFLTHLFVLAILFVLPDVLFSIGKPYMRFVYIRPLIYLLIFYLNYYVLIDRLLFERKRRWMFYVVNILLTVGVIFGVYLISRAMMSMRPDHAHTFRPPLREEVSWISHHALKMIQFCLRDGVLTVLTIALSVALKLSEKWLKWDSLQKKMLAERQENELKNLKNQLNPHFLFNTLNNIYALISISQPKAQQAVHELSQLLRYVLYDNETKEVPLEKDLNFIKNYIELMRLRLSSNVKLTVDICQNDLSGKNIAPLLFISLVENAFKHGVSSSKDSFITISITLDGGGVVKCRVENSYFPKGDADKSGSGIGLSNLERQLSILYPDRYALTTHCEDNIYTAQLNITLIQNNKL